MEKPIFILFLAIGCTFTSCKKNDSIDDGDLLGTWSYVAYIDDQGEQLVNDCESQNIKRFKIGNVFDFEYHNKNNTGNECIEGTHDSGKWSYLFNEKVQMNHATEENPDIVIAKYKISEDVLTLTFDEGNGEYKEVYRKQ
ncbi:lipocalin family protein [Zobellia sp.]|nr:lipocalin family protein [Zobellia sp.]